MKATKEEIECATCEGAGTVPRINTSDEKDCGRCSGTGKVDNTVRVQWDISADIECPKCEHDNDFMEVDEWDVICGVAENKNFDHPEDFNCTVCGHYFQIDGSDY